ncbi:phosphomevalonate kinase [Lentilactobacillus kisonensis DSM 19906 = JCM 15041]|uniref:phosphomevalonate kinase n=2 Tax=Lentilactobacillus kisonensis TaxID=481722 RepID=H1LG70_9LACO|nr:phosphomevalonate kinase [Lentilactobacillus kisonensis F0435]KRL23397.1 phosphomevalonate kinase [Lentilactobacillus kisonensis DSM 19906 = JCM 15041]
MCIIYKQKGNDPLITVKAPGKLYIAGEYAVVETGYPSIIVALNQFVTVEISRSKSYGSIVSKQYRDDSVFWRRQGDQMILDNRDNTFNYIISAIRLTEAYAQALNRPMDLYDLRINSDLDSPNGKKYGLGSSAAVTVATVKALCQFYQLPLTKSQLFKLSAIAHLDVQGNGSLGDIAASVYGGWIAYRSFDRNWLIAARSEQSLTELVNQPWPHLQITQLTPPRDLRLIIGWTGTPASTSHLVDKVAIQKSRQHQVYDQFLMESKKCLEELIQGFKDGSLETIKTGIKRNREILQHLAAFTKVAIETPTLKKMCDIAVENSAAAKSSGAGGGDCGIVVIDKHTDVDSMIQRWQENGITRLSLSVHPVIDINKE